MLPSNSIPLTQVDAFQDIVCTLRFVIVLSLTLIESCRMEPELYAHIVAVHTPGGNVPYQRGLRAYRSAEIFAIFDEHGRSDGASGK